MEYSKEDLAEARRQIDSTLHKLRETIKTLESKENPARYKSQITLAKTQSDCVWDRQRIDRKGDRRKWNPRIFS